MGVFKRSLAPISTEAWEFLDEEASQILKTKLNGRKVVDFVGPEGFDYAAVNTGRRSKISGKGEEGVSYKLRNVIPLLELKVPFKIKKEEFEALNRGASDVDTGPLIKAAQKLADAENKAIFHGLPAANIDGIVDSSDHSKLDVSDNSEDLLPAIITAVQDLMDRCVTGPYTLLICSEFYKEIYRINNKGYPLNRKIKEIIGDNIQLIYGLGTKGIVLSTRGGDFELVVGQDISLGYEECTSEEVEFYLFETFTFRVNTPEAAVILS
ncbi:MAG: family 1 encapsulin nanocompartment shell protein [Halothermotrichaceae bacterium]